MKHFIAEITWENPYPKKYDYRVSASNLGLGLKRAFYELRKENKGRRIKSLSIKIQEYGQSKTL